MIAIVGPTASGKTEYALRLAREKGGEIISVDSRQVYKFLSVGTAKPHGTWTVDRIPSTVDRAQRTVNRKDGSRNTVDDSVYLVQDVPYHLVDIWDPRDPFTAADFVRLTEEKAAEIRHRNKVPILVGGTGLYLKAFLQGLAPLPPRDEGLREQLYALAETKGRPALHAQLSKIDPVAADKIPPNNIARVIRALEVHHLTGKPISQWHKEHQKRQNGSKLHAIKLIGIALTREELHERIEQRCRAMLKNGLVEETKHLLKKGYPASCPALTGLGYPRVMAYLEKKISKQDLLDLLMRDTRQYAKRQMTWFRHQLSVSWKTL